MSTCSNSANLSKLSLNSSVSLKLFLISILTTQLSWRLIFASLVAIIHHHLYSIIINAGNLFL